MQNSKSRLLGRRRFLHSAAGGLVAGGLLGCGQTSYNATSLNIGSANRNGSSKRRSSDPTGSQNQYPFFVAQGDHRDLGRQHGEQAAEQIQGHLEFMARTMEFSRRQLQQRALQFKPLFEQHCPHLLIEMEGLAEGAKISLAEALAVNIRGVLKFTEHESCTAYVIGRSGTASGEILAGQNSDMFLPEIMEFGYVLHLKPIDKPEILNWTFGGMIGYHGINSAGLGHFANNIGGGPKPQFGMPHYPLKRLMHECTRIQDVVQLMEKTPVAVNGNYVLCDGNGELLDIESTTRGPKRIEEDGAGYLAHTNHYLCDEYATPANHDQCADHSFARLKRMNAMIQEKLGSITVKDVQGFLADHMNYPTSICRHQKTIQVEDGVKTTAKTVAAIVAEPAQRRMHVAMGNPCENRFVTYSMT